MLPLILSTKFLSSSSMLSESLEANKVSREDFKFDLEKRMGTEGRFSSLSFLRSWMGRGKDTVVCFGVSTAGVSAASFLREG
jgi:hypothetical protein